MIVGSTEAGRDQKTQRVLLRTTPFPNHLLDNAMPRLRDTEWRLLCVLVRQTLGWQNKSEGGRKQRDWLTQAQLKKRTGRDSAAPARPGPC